MLFCLIWDVILKGVQDFWTSESLELMLLVQTRMLCAGLFMTWYLPSRPVTVIHFVLTINCHVCMRCLKCLKYLNLTLKFKS